MLPSATVMRVARRSWNTLISLRNLERFWVSLEPLEAARPLLVQLIPRLYDVTEGQVLVDGVDVREYSLKNLRDGVGMVLQKNVLFSRYHRREPALGQ